MQSPSHQQQPEEPSLRREQMNRPERFQITDTPSLETLQRYAESIPEEKHLMRFINTEEEVIEAFLRRSALHGDCYEVSGRDSKTIIVVDSSGAITEKYKQDGYERAQLEVTEEVLTELGTILDAMQALGRQGDFDYF